MLLSVLLLTLPYAFESDLKLQANVRMISLRSSSDQTSARGGERKEEALGLDLRRQRSAGDGRRRPGQREVRLLQTIQLMVTPIPWCNWTFLDQPFTSNGMIHGVIFHFATLLFKLLTARSCCIFWNKITHWGGKLLHRREPLTKWPWSLCPRRGLAESNDTLMGYCNAAVNQPPSLCTQTVNLKCIPSQQNVNVSRWEIQTLGENVFFRPAPGGWCRWSFCTSRWSLWRFTGSVAAI